MPKNRPRPPPSTVPAGNPARWSGLDAELEAPIRFQIPSESVILLALNCVKARPHRRGARSFVDLLGRTGPARCEGFILRRFFAALLFTALTCAAAFGADPFRVIKPTDEAHKLLPKTCEVCHKGESLNFFVVTAKEAKQLEEALKLLSAGARNINISVGSANRREREAPKNPHVSGTCLFCHVEQPLSGSPVEEMEFRTITGVVKGANDQEAMCRLCHPNLAPTKHPKVFTSDSKAAPDLEAVGLKLFDGKAACTTCHDMHDPAAVDFCLREKVKDFFKTSVNAVPHGRKPACLACHTTEQQPGTTPRFVESDRINMCIRCHGGDHPKHAYGVGNSEKTYPMDFLAFPIGSDGKLVCTTCHDEPCTVALDQKNPLMLRGGPYHRLGDMCEKCHPKGGQLAINPHNQLGKDGKPIASTCNFCHLKDPWEGEFGPGNMNYRESPSELCTSCHKYRPHPTRDHLVDLGQKQVKSLSEYESRHKVKLPLYGDAKISCYTCHNPHGKGVLSGTEALGAGELKQLRIPSFAEVCVPCHKRYD